MTEEQLAPLREAITKAINDHAGIMFDEATCLASEWVVVANGVDVDGDSYLTRLGSENLLRHQRDGLLHQALHKMDD